VRRYLPTCWKVNCLDTSRSIHRCHESQTGKFELCNQGTILLDEIGEIPPSLQAKLLHVLQDQQFSRLGGRSVIKVDVRILAATNIDILASLASGKLRQDLFYRLDGFSITLPPLGSENRRSRFC